MKKKIMVLLISVLMVLMVTLCFNAQKIFPVYYKNVFPRKLPDWQGIITIWHITSCRTSIGSHTYILKDTAKKFEKNNTGIYINIESVSLEKYKKRIAEGIYPDILSYPAEIAVSLDKCIELDENPNNNKIYKDITTQINNKSTPVLMTVPIFMFNYEKCQRAEISPSRTIDSDTIVSYVEKLEKKYDKSFVATKMALYGMDLDIEKSYTQYQAFIKFASKENYMLIGTLWDNAAMGRMLERNKGFDFIASLPPKDRPLFLWTQWLCAFEDNDEDKNIIMREYIRQVTTKENQEKLVKKTGCMSVQDIDINYGDIRDEYINNKYKYLTIEPGNGMYLIKD
jgi:ABC-type glycerol-3-phosphate transport system substrate-binding protein